MKNSSTDRIARRPCLYDSYSPLPTDDLASTQSSKSFTVKQIRGGELFSIYTPKFQAQLDNGHSHGRWYFRPLVRASGPPVSNGYATKEEAMAAVNATDDMGEVGKAEVGKDKDTSDNPTLADLASGWNLNHVSRPNCASDHVSNCAAQCACEHSPIEAIADRLAYLNGDSDNEPEDYRRGWAASGTPDELAVLNAYRHARDHFGLTASDAVRLIGAQRMEFAREPVA